MLNGDHGFRKTRFLSKIQSSVQSITGRMEESTILGKSLVEVTNTCSPRVSSVASVSHLASGHVTLGLRTVTTAIADLQFSEKVETLLSARNPRQSLESLLESPHIAHTREADDLEVSSGVRVRKVPANEVCSTCSQRAIAKTNVWCHGPKSRGFNHCLQSLQPLLCITYPGVRTVKVLARTPHRM